MGRKQLSEFEKGKIVGLADHGVAMREIGRRLDRDIAVISRFLKRFRATGSVQRRKGSGAKRKTSTREDRFIERQMLKKRRISSGNFFFSICFRQFI